MPEIRSVYWDSDSETCTKHNSKGFPCEKCLAEHDKRIEAFLTNDDQMLLNDRPGLALSGLFPRKDLKWLANRIVGLVKKTPAPS